ncbi:17736_t:CDS:2 [Cetraspora pellucida]|uniref:17736_t:CDS:1 n=1 Tax=Cetraspora pellucida TaxID=1433469 RepID=A0A9N9NU69_9GLOM|nr:17736_t:CDS:2 [Cetraspora pellucida]
MNCTIESKLSGRQTVVTFIEWLYGLKLLHKNLNKKGTGQVIYEADLVEPTNHSDYYYVKKYYKLEVINLDFNDESMEVEKSNTTSLQSIKELLTNNKNNKIYLGSTDETYQKIICLYNNKGILLNINVNLVTKNNPTYLDIISAHIFYLFKKSSNVCTDFFRTLKLSQQ